MIKSGKIRRGIESRHARTDVKTFRLGRVARMRDLETGGTGDSSNKGLWTKRSRVMDATRRRILWIWSSIFSLVTLAVIGGFMLFWLRTHQNSNTGVSSAHAENRVRIVSKFVSPGEVEALDFVERALANRDLTKVESFFRLGEASPAEVVDFLAGSEARDGMTERYLWLSSMDVEGFRMDGVLVMYDGKESPSERLAFLTPNEDGVWKVDFDAFARTSRPSWKDLLECRTDRSQVRVFVAKDNYYNGLFGDETQWRCFGMMSLESKALLSDGRELLRGYCKTDSPQAKAMDRLLRGNAKTLRVTLEILRHKGADSRQFEITRVLAGDWVLPTNPLDEQFD